MSWANDVDVCRGQISGDTAEWTFYTGDGFPKATNSELVGSGGSLPANYRRLGIPGPTGAVGVSATTPEAERTSATINLSSATLAQIDLAYGLEITIDGGRTWTRTTALSSASASAVAAAISATGPASATVSGGLSWRRRLPGAGTGLGIRWGTGSSQFQSVLGATTDLGEPETRVYTFTWVNIESGLSMESAAAPPSATVDVYTGAAVTLDWVRRAALG
ncbi:MAG: hypothetical protein MZV65_39455 [Chromatiales bacterium]|nr:hypothetical protein [Chromatiales bacterium]